MKEEKRTQIMQKTAVVWFGALVCCALWGSAFPCIKIGYQMFEIDAADTAAQILFAGYRFTLAGILTVLIGSVLNKGFLIPKKESLEKIFKLSMLQTVLQYFFFLCRTCKYHRCESFYYRRRECLCGSSRSEPFISTGEADREKNRRLSDRFCRSCHCQFRRQHGYGLPADR